MKQIYGRFYVHAVSADACATFLRLSARKLHYRVRVVQGHFSGFGLGWMVRVYQKPEDTEAMRRQEDWRQAGNQLDTHRSGWVN